MVVKVKILNVAGRDLAMELFSLLFNSVTEIQLLQLFCTHSFSWVLCLRPNSAKLCESHSSNSVLLAIVTLQISYVTSPTHKPLARFLPRTKLSLLSDWLVRPQPSFSVHLGIQNEDLINYINSKWNGRNVCGKWLRVMQLVNGKGKSLDILVVRSSARSRLHDHFLCARLSIIVNLFKNCKITFALHLLLHVR